MANKVRDLTGLRIGMLEVIKWDVHKALTTKAVKGRNQHG